MPKISLLKSVFLFGVALLGLFLLPRTVNRLAADTYTYSHSYTYPYYTPPPTPYYPSAPISMGSNPCYFYYPGCTSWQVYDPAMPIPGSPAAMQQQTPMPNPYNPVPSAALSNPTLSTGLGQPCYFYYPGCTSYVLYDPGIPLPNSTPTQRLTTGAGQPCYFYYPGCTSWEVYDPSIPINTAPAQTTVPGQTYYTQPYPTTPYPQAYTAPTYPQNYPYPQTYTAPSYQSVVMADNYYSPAHLTIPAGTTVTWTNQGAMNHTVTADTGSFESGTLNRGAFYQYTFNQPGTYRYYCRLHGAPGGRGMSGIITVTGNAAPGNYYHSPTTGPAPSQQPSHVPHSSVRYY